MSRRSFRRSLRRRDSRRRSSEAPLKRRPEPGVEAAAEQELQLRSLPEHLQPKRSKCPVAAKAGAEKKNPVRSALEGNLRRRSPPGADGKQALRAMVAGAATDAEEGRSRSRLPGRKR